MSEESKAQYPYGPMIDIGANLLDGMYQGHYHGKQRHEPDLDLVIQRAAAVGVTHIMVTAGSLPEAKEALEFTKKHPTLYSTVGVHPTRAGEFDAHAAGPDEYEKALLELALEGKAAGKVVAIGECGLDYDRLFFCDKDTQLRHFERHFRLTEATKLPMFLHNRNCGSDLADILRRNRHRFTDGVIHSFTGPLAEMEEFLGLGLYIGINGCSLKTEENLQVAAAIPADRLMIETDCPWCEIKPTHASSKYLSKEANARWKWSKPEKMVPAADCCVKSRSEPCHLLNVVEVLAKLRGVDPRELAAQTFDNTKRVFFSSHQ